MKKVEKVSIAEISFTLDNDAYVSLRQYLDSINSYYENDPDGREIARDIEARIAELILDEQVYTKVVSKPVIDSIIAQLGTPEEIDNEAGEGEGFSSEAKASAGGGASDSSMPRRLHRSAEGKIFGGVCSGIARYLDTNVAWVRLVFLLPLILRVFVAPFDWHRSEEFFEGWGWVFFVTYMVLWVALPMAKTPRQKLEARGQKITSASIRQNLQSTVSTPAGQKAASVTAELVTVVGRVLLFFVKFVVAIVGFSLLFAAIGIFMGMFILPFEPTRAVVVDGVSILPVFDGMSILSPVMFIELILLCTLLPLVVMGMALLSFVFSWRLGRTFYGATLGLWGAAMIFAGIVSASNARFFRERLPEQIERWGVWSYDDRDDGKWHGRWEYDREDGRYERRDRRPEEEAVLDTLRNGDELNIDADKDSLVIVVKRDGTPGDTINISRDGFSVSATLSDSIPAARSTPDSEGRKRVEIRRVE